MTAPRAYWPPLRRADRAFHELWTKAVGTAGYDKRQWKRLGQLIDDLALIARREMSEDEIERLRGAEEKGVPEK